MTWPSRSVALEERKDLRGPLGRLLEGRPVAAIVEQHHARVGNVIEDRDADLDSDHPIAAPWLRRTGVLMPDRSGGRTRVYAGMRTFISVTPWIRFE